MSSYTVQPLPSAVSKRLDEIFGVENALVEFNPGKCALPPYHDRFCQKILEAEVRDDDVWLLSFPRTGSTWCQEMVWLLGNNLDFDTARTTMQQFRAPLIEMSTALPEFHGVLGSAVEDSVAYINSMDSPRFIKSHLPAPLLPIQLDKIKPKIIYTSRNPKDMCVSYYFHCQLTHHLNCPFEEFCELLMDGVLPLGPIFPHYLHWWHKRNEPNVLFLKYEDMNRDPRGTIDKLAAFLEKPYSAEQLDSLCEFLSFRNMRDNRGCNLEQAYEDLNGKDFFKRTGKHFIRKGQIGDWKNHMSEEMARRFDCWIDENTRGTGLTFDEHI